LVSFELNKGVMLWARDGRMQYDLKKKEEKKNQTPVQK
jgi:hypothetical protein